METYYLVCANDHNKNFTEGLCEEFMKIRTAIQFFNIHVEIGKYDLYYLWEYPTLRLIMSRQLKKEIIPSKEELRS